MAAKNASRFLNTLLLTFLTRPTAQGTYYILHTLHSTHCQVPTYQVQRVPAPRRHGHGPLPREQAAGRQAAGEQARPQVID
jgi:hypothetical protein